MANPNHRIFYPTKSIGIVVDENSPEYTRIKDLQKKVDELNITVYENIVEDDGLPIKTNAVDESP